MLEEAKYKLLTTEQTYGIVKETLDTNGFMGWQQSFFYFPARNRREKKRRFSRRFTTRTRTVQCAIQ